MASLYFYYSSMDSGKSTYLLQSAHNYRSAGKNVLLMTPAIDTRFGQGKIASRIGLESGAESITAKDQLLSLVKRHHGNEPLSCVMVDEAQFLSEQQVWELSDVVDVLNVPVLCFGLRTDAFGALFPGSKLLLGIADQLNELKSICRCCEKKATMQIRLDEQGSPVSSGNQVQIGGNDTYLSVCRRHYKELVNLL